MHLDWGDTNPITREFKLYCENKIYSTTLASSVYLGSFLGFFIFPYIADRNGRKIALVISWIFTTLGTILPASSVNYTMLLISTFITGFGILPAVTIHYSLLSEHSSGKFRQ